MITWFIILILFFIVDEIYLRFRLRQIQRQIEKDKGFTWNDIQQLERSVELHYKDNPVEVVSVRGTFPKDQLDPNKDYHEVTDIFSGKLMYIEVPADRTHEELYWEKIKLLEERGLLPRVRTVKEIEEE